LRNQAHRFKIDAVIRKLANRRQHGGMRWNERPMEENIEHIMTIFLQMQKHIEAVQGKVGIEIGPGDNVGVAYCFLKLGCKKIYAIEQFPSIIVNKRLLNTFEHIDERFKSAGMPSYCLASDIIQEEVGHYSFQPDRLIVTQTIFEDASIEPVDFIYSNDVLEHIANPRKVFQKAYQILKTDGIFVNSIDLAGHNVFSNPLRPLDFLTCPDWLWELMFSHIVTTNRLRLSDFVQAAKAAGFQIKRENVLLQTNAEYLNTIRPHFLPRYRQLPDADLTTVQCLLAAQKNEIKDE